MEKITERCASVWHISVAECRTCDGTYKNKGRCPNYCAEEIPHRGILPEPPAFEPTKQAQRGHRNKRQL